MDPNFLLCKMLTMVGKDIAIKGKVFFGSFNGIPENSANEIDWLLNICWQNHSAR